MGDGVQDGQAGNNITGYWILLLSSAAVAVATVSFLVIRRNRVETPTDEDDPVVPHGGTQSRRKGQPYST
jgi:hypothetical protein